MQTNGKFYVREGKGFVEVVGYTQPFDDYNGILDLFLHQDVAGSGWCVSEGKTGLRVSTVSASATAELACIAAREFVGRFGLYSFMDGIDVVIKTRGLSPRYAGAGEPTVAAAPAPPPEASQAENHDSEAAEDFTGPSRDLSGCG